MAIAVPSCLLPDDEPRMQDGARVPPAHHRCRPGDDGHGGGYRRLVHDCSPVTEGDLRGGGEGQDRVLVGRAPAADHKEIIEGPTNRCRRREHQHGSSGVELQARKGWHNGQPFEDCTLPRTEMTIWGRV